MAFYRQTSKTLKRLKPKDPAWAQLIDWILSLVAGIKAHAWSGAYVAEAGGVHEIVFDPELSTSAFEIFAEGRIGGRRVEAHIVEDSKLTTGFSVYVREACNIHYYIIRHR